MIEIGSLASPPQQGVTDEMVERAGRMYRSLCAGYYDPIAMKHALNAALTPSQGERS
jgi:hypothetical protein